MNHRYISIALMALLIPLASIAQTSSSTTTGLSNLMNPAISVNGLLLGQTDMKNSSREVNGIGLQEAEIQCSAVVDPFWKANVIVSFFPEHFGSEYCVGIEEANVTSTALPAGIALKAGKFFLPFGKHSPLHTHQFPFIEAPRPVETLLGEGLTDTGVLLAISIPLPWFSDLMVYGVDGAAEIFEAAHRDITAGGRWVNFWDVSDEGTLEIGTSLLAGQASPDFFGQGGRRYVYGADLTYKWTSSAQSHGPAVTFQNEALFSTFENGDDTPYGWYSLAQYRFHRNWWIGATHGQVKYDIESTAGTSDPLCVDTHEYKINLTATPSEFSAVRFEAAWYDDRVHDNDEFRLAVQCNFTIGSHPAHLY